MPLEISTWCTNSPSIVLAAPKQERSWQAVQSDWLNLRPEMMSLFESILCFYCHTSVKHGSNVRVILSSPDWLKTAAANCQIIIAGNIWSFKKKANRRLICMILQEWWLIEGRVSEVCLWRQWVPCLWIKWFAKFRGRAIRPLMAACRADRAFVFKDIRGDSLKDLRNIWDNWFIRNFQPWTVWSFCKGGAMATIGSPRSCRILSLLNWLISGDTGPSACACYSGRKKSIDIVTGCGKCAQRSCQRWAILSDWLPIISTTS